MPALTLTLPLTQSLTLTLTLTLTPNPNQVVAASLIPEDNEPISLTVLFGEASGGGVPRVSYP